MSNYNYDSSVKLGKLLKRFKLTTKNKQRIIQETQKDNSTWSSLERLVRKLEFKKSLFQKTPK